MFYCSSDFLVPCIVLPDILLQLGLCQTCLKSLLYPFPIPFFFNLTSHIQAILTWIKLIFRQVKLSAPVKCIFLVIFGLSYINYFAGCMSV